MQAKHFIADVDEMISDLEARQQRNIDAVREISRELTPVEDARFSIGWGMIRDMALDLQKMRNAWADGCPAYYATEQMLTDADNAAASTTTNM